MNKAVELGGHSDMIRPPVNHIMKVLDRSFFRKNIRVCAAQVFNPKDISKTRAELNLDLLHIGRLKSMVSVPGHESKMKAFLLRPEIKNEGTLLVESGAKKTCSEHNAHSLVQISSLGARNFESSIMLKK